MPRLAFLALLATACAAPQRPPAPAAEAPPRLAYPAAPRSDHTDTLHGATVADPYRWLEEIDSPETKAWIEAENRLSFGVLDRIPERAAIRRRLEQVWNYERFSVPHREGGRTFYERNDGLQDQPVLYVVDAPGGQPRTLLDANDLSTDGTVALKLWSVSRDGKRLAYSLSTAGSDWVEVRVRDVDTAQDLTDRIAWVKFSNLTWLPDGSGFFYCSYDEPPEGEELKESNFFQKLWLHRLGTPQSADRLVHEDREHKEWGWDAQVSDDGRFLVVHVWKGSIERNQLYYVDLSRPDAPVTELITGFEAEYAFLDNDDRTFWLRTTKDAPRGRVIAVDLDAPAPDRWRELIPQAAEPLQGVAVVGERFVAAYLADARSEVRLFRLDGTPDGRIDLPALGTASGFSGERADTDTYYAFTSFLFPTTILRYDFATRKSEVFRRPEIGIRFEDYETRQLFYASRDGTRVPMFVTLRRGAALDGSHPVYLYGYGGFNISLTPRFSPAVLTWLELGGVFAMPNLRGGGEYGEEWHEAGMGGRKQNVFDDFIAAGEHLISQGYTTRERLAAVGASNGGLLVGAVLVQRPDLWGAALPDVGVMDMLRFHKFTIGWAWAEEYGSPDVPEDFAVLRGYSPLHNLRPAAYPPTLVTTADHDDRVFPAHSFKFAAALQHVQQGPAPVLIRVETRAGHGAGKPTSMRIDEAADKLGFALWALGGKLPEGFGGAEQPLLRSHQQVERHDALRVQRRAAQVQRPVEYGQPQGLEVGRVEEREGEAPDGGDPARPQRAGRAGQAGERVRVGDHAAVESAHQGQVHGARRHALLDGQGRCRARSDEQALGRQPPRGGPREVRIDVREAQVQPREAGAQALQYGAVVAGRVVDGQPPQQPGVHPVEQRQQGIDVRPLLLG